MEDEDSVQMTMSFDPRLILYCWGCMSIHDMLREGDYFRCPCGALGKCGTTSTTRGFLNRNVGVGVTKTGVKMHLPACRCAKCGPHDAEISGAWSERSSDTVAVGVRHANTHARRMVLVSNGLHIRRRCMRRKVLRGGLMLRSRWFDRHRQDARDRMKQGDGCVAGIAFLLLTCLLVIGMIVLVQIGVL
jgi:hypothetical protein